MRLPIAPLLLLISLALFVAFGTNVLFGASGRGAFLSDVGELLVLFASCTFFVAATLRLEKQRKLRGSLAENADP